VAKLEELQSALAEAKDALTDAVIRAADEGRGDPNPELEKLRAHCRQIRAAIVKLERLELASQSTDDAIAPGRQSDDASKEGIGSNRPSRQEGPTARRGTRPQGQAQATQARRKSRFRIGSSAPECGHEAALAKQALLRQTISLLFLVLSYLQYYLIDVNVQIASLPSQTRVTLISPHWANSPERPRSA